MSVRKRNRKDLETGKSSEVWMIDVKFAHANGQVERIRKKSPVQTRRGAEKYEHDVREALLNGKYRVSDVGCPTLEQFSTEFITNYAEVNNKPSEVEAKRSVLRVHLLPELGHLRLDAIGKREIEAYKATKHRAGLKAKTINNHLTVLAKLLSVAVEWDVITHAVRPKWAKAAEPPFRYLQFEEADALVEHADPAWKTMILVALKTGLRIGELLALRWQDVDLAGKRILVRQAVSRGLVGTPKNHRSREVGLCEAAIAALKGHRHLRGPYVFCDERGAMLTRNGCRRPLEQACDKAGLKRLSWHVARHTFASHLVMRGANIKQVQELLGHADIKMTMRYAHLSPQARLEAVSLLDGTARGTIGAPQEGGNENSSQVS